jgi:hypothetical protein
VPLISPIAATAPNVSAPSFIWRTCYTTGRPTYTVMPGLVPGIHALVIKKDVDGRDKPGHDEMDEP